MRLLSLGQGSGNRGEYHEEERTLETEVLT